MDLCFAFRFYWIRPVSPLKRSERNEIEVEALLEFRGVGIFHECYGALLRFCDVNCWKDFTVKAAGESDARVVRWYSWGGCDTDASDGDVCFVVCDNGFSVVVFILITVYTCSDDVQFIVY